MRLTTLSIDGRTYELAPNAELDGLKKAIERAVTDGGKFVEVTAAGNVSVSILVTPGVPIFLTTREIATDENDDAVNTADTFDVAEWEIRGAF